MVNTNAAGDEVASQFPLNALIGTLGGAEAITWDVTSAQRHRKLTRHQDDSSIAELTGLQYGFEGLLFALLCSRN
jgi:hypothetical protein